MTVLHLALCFGMRFACRSQNLLHFVIAVWGHLRRPAFTATGFHCESATDLARTLDQSCFIIQSCKLVIGQSTPALHCVSHPTCLLMTPQITHLAQILCCQQCLSSVIPRTRSVVVHVGDLSSEIIISTGLNHDFSWDLAELGRLASRLTPGGNPLGPVTRCACCHVFLPTPRGHLVHGINEGPHVCNRIDLGDGHARVSAEPHLEAAVLYLVRGPSGSAYTALSSIAQEKADQPWQSTSRARFCDWS